MPYRFRSVRHRYTLGRYSFSSTPRLCLFPLPPSSSSPSSSSDPSTFSTPLTFLQRPFPIINLCISSSRSAYRNIRSRCNRADSSFNRRVRCTYVSAEYKKMPTKTQGRLTLAASRSSGPSVLSDTPAALFFFFRPLRFSGFLQPSSIAPSSSLLSERDVGRSGCFVAYCCATTGIRAYEQGRDRPYIPSSSFSTNIMCFA